MQKQFLSHIKKGYKNTQIRRKEREVSSLRSSAFHLGPLKLIKKAPYVLKTMYLKEKKKIINLEKNGNIVLVFFRKIFLTNKLQSLKKFLAKKKSSCGIVEVRKCART